MKHIYKIFAALTAILAIWMLPDDRIEREDTVSFKAFEITIEGAVLYPKTLRFYEPVSFQDLLMYAGGYHNALENFKPLKVSYHETTKITIPFKKTEEIELNTQKININKASFSELLKIPSMTETRAAELIIYRQKNGPFLSIEELIHVKFIGSVTLENMRPYISLS
jgi:competence protein ComEA